MARRAHAFCDDGAVSDDDLWRPMQGQSDRSTGHPAAPPSQNPFGAPSPYAAPPPQNPYAEQDTGPAAPPANPYGSPAEYAAPPNPYATSTYPSYAGGGPAEHPSATTAMVLGIVALAGLAFTAGLTLVVAPAAWIVGARAVREIDAAPGRYAGRDRAQAGKVMGIIGTVLLVLEVLTIIALVALLFSVASSGTGPVSPTPHVRHAVAG